MAKLLGVPRGTIESRLHRARQQLKEKFAGYLDEPM
jgi:DNA-directed RNA polymerase specialized sigma24 family protein